MGLGEDGRSLVLSSVERGVPEGVVHDCLEGFQGAHIGPLSPERFSSKPTIVRSEVNLISSPHPLQKIVCVPDIPILTVLMVPHLWQVTSLVSGSLVVVNLNVTLFNAYH